MSETKFTKGGWLSFYPHELLNSGHVSVENEDGRQICISEVHRSDLVEKTANVKLIAAAPDMYHLLEEMASYDECQMFKGQINKILAKARGES